MERLLRSSCLLALFFVGVVNGEGVSQNKNIVVTTRLVVKGCVGGVRLYHLCIYLFLLV